MIRTDAFENYMPKEIKENLEKDEELIKIVETFSVKNTPEFLALTDSRVIYLEKKMFGRYNFVAIPYMKMLSANAKIGKMWGEFTVKGESEKMIHLKMVKREGIVSTFESMKSVINKIAGMNTKCKIVLIFKNCICHDLMSLWPCSGISINNKRKVICK